MNAERAKKAQRREKCRVCVRVHACVRTLWSNGGESVVFHSFLP